MCIFFSESLKLIYLLKLINVIKPGGKKKLRNNIISKLLQIRDKYKAVTSTEWESEVKKGGMVDCNFCHKNLHICITN